MNHYILINTLYYVDSTPAPIYQKNAWQQVQLS